MDIDFDGAAPASVQKEPESGLSGLEGLAGTPVRTESPAVGAPQQSNLDDLLGVFGDGGGNTAPPMAGPSTNGTGASASADLMDGLAGLNMSDNTTTSPPPQGNQQKKTNEDILSLF